MKFLLFVIAVFVALADCLNICELPKEFGPCQHGTPRWGFDVKKAKCVKFIYGGCQGNENNFMTQEQCNKACGRKN